jgi:hypothetical protein
LSEFVGVEDPQHQFFAERRRHGRQPEFDLAPGRCFGLNPTILWATLVSDVHAPKRFQSTRYGG